MIKIIIDPRSNYAYGSFYIAYLEEKFKGHVSYRIAPFKDLMDIGKDMRFVVREGDKETKYFLHLNDPYDINRLDYEWCDVYGNVNANFANYPKKKFPKQISLVPSFGVRVEADVKQVLWHSFLRFIQTASDVLHKKEWNKVSQRMECKPFLNIKHYFGRRYKAWRDRLPLSVYDESMPSEDNYIFFLSTLWYNNKWNNTDETVNRRRANFIKACKSLSYVIFDGGLLGDSSSSNDKFADVLAEHGEPFAIWIEKTKRSALVFNTPAFWDCHGWKLGEYLALGKCIVSTKLSNDLPYPLEHGKNIHFVEDNEESMREAIEYILAHPEYRHKLEQGARAYWEKYGTPEASLKLLGIS